MPIQKIITKGKVPVKIYTDDIDSAAFQQLYNLSQPQLSFINSHIAVMPDVHVGKGTTVGSVISNLGRDYFSFCGCRYWLRYECDTAVD